MSSQPASATLPRAPDGFLVERVAGEAQTVFPMFAAFDEHGRLFVAESSGLDLYAELKAQTRKCRVKLLEDRDGDGRFETATVFADELVFPMGLVWRDGKLYVADPPDLLVLEDTDGDGRADKRSVVLAGFGHTDNGSLHGLTFGPEGLLYMTMGSPDGYRLKRDDGTFVEGQSGALIRCRPDGSGVEVICRGFVNLVEVAFIGSGEVIGTDNWYQQPSGGVRDALVHLVEGGLYPFEPDQGTPQAVTGDPLPPLSLLPAVALSGLAIYRGDAFPAEMRGNLFSAQHNTRRIGRHALKRMGSTFQSDDFDFVSSDDPDFHPSDVIEDADGSMLVVDTGGWYVQHCPTGRIRDSRAPGGIYRVRCKNTKRIEDPWGLKLDWAQISVEELAGLLGDRRPMVRDRAQQVLTKRAGETVRALTALLDHSTNVVTRQHAIWSLANIPVESSLAPLREALKHSNPDIATTAARALALRKDRSAAPDLVRLLRSGDSRTQMAAAEALVHCGTDDVLPAIWQALAFDPDRFLEHALIHAAHRLADVSTLEAGLRHSHPRVQKAVLLLLSQPPRPRAALKHEEVMARASARDADLRQAALKVLQGRAEWIQPTTALIKSWLTKAALSDENRSELRSLIVAFQSNASVQEAIGQALTDKQTTESVRLLLIESLAESALPTFPASWIEGLRYALRSASPALRAQAVRTVALLQVPVLDGDVAVFADNHAESPAVRLEAMRAIVARSPGLSVPRFEFLLGTLKEKSDALARLATVEVLRRAHLDERQLMEALKAIRDDALVSPGGLLSALQTVTDPPRAEGLVALLEEMVRAGWHPAETDLDNLAKRLPATLRGQVDTLKELLRKNAVPDRARLAEFEPLLRNGDPDRGRAVFVGGKVACSVCHAAGSVGGRIGPDLTKIGAIRSGRDILESIVLPSASFAQGYEPYVVELSDGREMTGVIARQSAEAIVLRDASGAESQFRRSQIKALTRQAVSIMPEGVEQGLSRDELRDLLAFLQGLK